MIHRTLANRVYVLAMVRNVAIPLAAGFALGVKLIVSSRVVAGLITIALAAVIGVWASHWTGWARAPRIARTPNAPRAAYSGSRLALVSGLAILLLAGCPPGDEPETPDDDRSDSTTTGDPSAGPSQ